MKANEEKQDSGTEGRVLEFKGRVFSGKLSSQNTSWSDAKVDLKERETSFFLSKMNGRSALSELNVQMSSEASYYKAKFRQGADLMPRRFFFIEADLGDGSNEVIQAKSNLSVDAKPPYSEIVINGLVDSQCLFRTAISQNIVPFGIDSPFLVHLPLVCIKDEWVVATPSVLAQHDLGNSATWFEKCDKLHAKKAGVERGTLFESLNYNNKLLVQNPSARRWVVFNAAGTNVSAAIVENTSLFWADQRTYWYCPTSKAEGDFLAAILNAPSLNTIIKPFQSVGLAGERDIHKKILELLPKYDNSNADMVKISGLGNQAKVAVEEILGSLKGKGIVTKRKVTRDHIQPILALIDEAVKELIQLKG